MATGEPGLLGELAQKLVQVELSPEPANATILHPPMEEPLVSDLQLNPEHATLKPALLQQVNIIYRFEFPFKEVCTQTQFYLFSVDKLASFSFHQVDDAGLIT